MAGLAQTLPSALLLLPCIIGARVWLVLSPRSPTSSSPSLRHRLVSVPGWVRMSLKGVFQLETDWVRTAVGRQWMGSHMELPHPLVSFLPGQDTQLTAWWPLGDLASPTTCLSRL